MPAKLTCSSIGFTPHPSSVVHDKMQHFLMFFLLTLLFYWIFDTTKRRILNMTIIFSLVIDIVSELAQSLVPVSPYVSSLTSSPALSISSISSYKHFLMTLMVVQLVWIRMRTRPKYNLPQ